MIKIIQGLVGFAASINLALLSAAEGAPACVLADQNLHIEVRSEPEDDAWGPTLQVLIADALQPINRMLVPEARPIEACWWGDIDGNPSVELVIGVGAEGQSASGALGLDWDGRALQRRPLPELPVQAKGVFRYVVADGQLWAQPIVARGAPADGRAWRLKDGQWALTARETRPAKVR